MKFTIEGFGHIREYLLHRPRSVINATCTAEQRETLPTRARRIVTVSDVAHAELSLTPMHEKELEVAVRSGRLTTLIALDHIYDPRNLGAIVRSAAFFGVRGIIIANRRQAQLTATVVETARGGFAFLDLYIVKNIGRLLVKLKSFDFWVIGADVRGERLQFCEFSRKVYLFGSEDKGIAPLLREQCDCLFRIPGHGDRAVESLNVAAATAVFLYSQCLSV